MSKQDLFDHLNALRARAGVLKSNIAQYEKEQGK